MKSSHFLSKLKKSARSIKAKARSFDSVRGQVRLKDLGYLEDQSDRKFFKTIGRRATEKAVQENNALGIPQTYWRDGKVLRSMPDGTVKVLHDTGVANTKSGKTARQLKKGTVLHVKK